MNYLMKFICIIMSQVVFYMSCNKSEGNVCTIRHAPLKNSSNHEYEYSNNDSHTTTLDHRHQFQAVLGMAMSVKRLSELPSP